MNLLKNMKVVRVANAAAAATTAIDTTVLDTSGYDSVCFIAVLGDVTTGSVLTLTGKTNTASSTSSPTPTSLTTTVTYTAGASDADNKMMILDLHKPRQRYVFASLTRTTANAVVDGIFAVLYNAHICPITVDSTVLVSALVNDPS